MKWTYLFIIGLILCSNSNAQTFEAVSFSLRTKGMVEWNSDQMVAFGKGLTWINKEGKIQDQKRLIEGLPSSQFIDALPDDQGGLWLLTSNSLARLSKDLKATLILGPDKFPKAKLKELHKSINGDFYCLSDRSVIKINNDNTTTLFFQAEENKYFNHFAMGRNNVAYVASYRNIFQINGKDDILKHEYPRNYNFKHVFYTKDDKVIIQGYQNLHEFKDGDLNYFLKGRNLTRGAKFYTGIFNNSNDFWLYANGGNAFHNNKGVWKNYTPPAGLKTGNFGEHIYQTKNGDIWMTLTGHIVLHFDGQKWQQYKIDKEQTLTPIGKSTLVNNQLIARDNKSNRHYTFQEGELVPNNKIPSRGVYQVKYSDGKYYYADKEGLYASQNGKEELINKGKTTGHGVLNGEVIYVQGKQVWSYKNGKSSMLKDNVHYLGWDDIGTVTMESTSDGKLIAFSSKRPKSMSIYDGTEWKKMISVNQKMIGNIKNIVKTKTDTYIENKKGDVFLFNGQELINIIEGDNIKQKYSGSQLIASNDNSSWYFSESEISVIQEGKVLQKMDLPNSMKPGTINAVVKIEEKVYDIYLRSEILRCSLP